MKKNNIIIALGAILISSLMLVNVNLNLNKNLFSSISLKAYRALACENLEGMSGYIGLSSNCYVEYSYMEGEYWITVSYAGCEDANATCTL